jgi:hypothetical protein
MTTEPYYLYSIRSNWQGRVETPAAIGAKYVKMLDTLSAIDPIFSDWLLTDFPNPSSGDEITDILNIKQVPLDTARPRITEIVENYVVLNDAGKPSPGEGYNAITLGGELNSPREVQIEVRAGGEGNGEMNLRFGSNWGPPDLTTVTYRLYKAALLAINAIWPAPWACAYAFGPGTVKAQIVPGLRGTVLKHVTQLPLDPTFPYSIFHIPWIAYLSAEHADGIALTRDILTERTPDGGLLMSTTTDRLDPDNPEHVRRARIIAETMISRFDPS